ncbi:MAG TPA: hypothetical protein VFF90_08720 [Saprospiraceae bacterium]|nr:hypothetical protein [Saprospiraceae bacterium]
MKPILLVLAFLAIQLTTQAQQGSLTILTFESYTFADKYETYYGYGKVEDAFSWGAGLEFGVDNRTAIELIYQNYKGDAYYDDAFFNRIYGTGTFNYIMLGGTSYAPMNEKVSGFGSFDLGMCIIHPSTELYSSDVTKFAMGGRLGVRIMPSDKISIRLHGQLMTPLQWFGGGYYFGTGGSGASVTAGGTIFQFNLGGSVNIRLR